MMPILNAIGRQLLDVLRTRLIPWASSGAPFVLLDAPPQQIGTNHISESPGPQLQTTRRDGQILRVQSWQEENLTSTALPYLGCIVEGEADIVMGTTAEMCRKQNILGKRWTLQAPQRTFFMTAPFVPRSGGQEPHWSRRGVNTAYARILWMQFHDTGVHCHFCTTDKGSHYTHPLYFIYGRQCLPLAEELIDEMSHQSPQYLTLVYLHLSTLLQYMVRGLLNKQTQNIKEPLALAPSHFRNTNDLIQRVTNFIDQHLYGYSLTADRIAAHVHLSPRHLARLFQQEMHIPIMKFVTRRRMEQASQLLIESPLDIAGVAAYCGYASVPSFIKAFKNYSGVSPSQYRTQNNLRQNRIIDVS